jgi:polyphenol oxidase
MSLPAVPDMFIWVQESWGAVLRCRPLDAIAPHLFTTRQPELSAHDGWRLVAGALGVRDIQTVTQVHGSSVLVARNPVGGRPEADVLVSNDPEIAIAVRAADCVPVLIGDPKTGAVAAVHAGWRGTAARAAPAAVDALAREFRARPGDLIAAIGPSIGACCYEVGTELVDAFAAAGHPRSLIDRWFVDAPKLRLDMWAANRDQLIMAGLEQRNIHTCGLCTASHIELFPSYRVERDKAGRMAAIIRTKGRM